MPELTIEQIAEKALPSMVTQLEKNDDLLAKIQKGLVKVDDLEALRKEIHDENESLKTQITDMQKAITERKLPDDHESKTLGYSNIAEFAYEVMQWTESKSYEGLGRLQKIHETQKGMKVAGPAAGSSSTGGTLIPTAFIEKPLIQELGNASLWNRCTSLPMSALKTEVPTFETGSQSSLLFYGGIRFYKPAEAGAITETSILGGSITIELHTLAGATSPTGTMMRHSPISVETLLKSMFDKGLAYILDRDVIAGTGANEPLGILNSKAKITVDAIAAQGAQTIIWENVRDMKARMPWNSRRNAVWVVNPDAMPQLEGMFIPAGMGGVPVFAPASGVSGQQYDTLYNRPIIECESCSALGTEGDIILFDPTMYLAAYSSGGAMWDTTPYVYFLYDRNTFRLLFERGGACWWTAARTPENGATKSCIITLNSTRT